MPTSVATNDDKVGIMAAFGFQWNVSQGSHVPCDISKHYAVVTKINANRDHPAISRMW